MTDEYSSLSGPELPPSHGGNGKQLIVFLHGFGSDGADLIELAPLLAKLFPDAHFISPNAPEPCEMGPFGFQWFSLEDWSDASMLAGVQQTAPILNAFLDEQLAKHGLSNDKLALIGFSQGTMMALYTALRRPKPCAAIVGFSGRMIAADMLIDDVKSRPPVCLIHGTDDPVVPFADMAKAEAALKAANVPVETHARPGLPHGIDNDGLRACAHFLQNHLKA